MKQLAHVGASSYHTSKMPTSWGVEDHTKSKVGAAKQQGLALVQVARTEAHKSLSHVVEPCSAYDLNRLISLIGDGVMDDEPAHRAKVARDS